MKTLMTAILIAATAAGISEAAKGDVTKEQFLAIQKAQKEKKGMEFNAGQYEKMFKQIDANGDGIASGMEKKAYWKKGASAPAAAPAAAATAPAVTKLKKGDSTLDMFLETQRAQKEKKGMEFNENMHKKMFEQMDTNSDGIVTGTEKKAYWSK